MTDEFFANSCIFDSCSSLEVFDEDIERYDEQEVLWNEMLQLNKELFDKNEALIEIAFK